MFENIRKSLDEYEANEKRLEKLSLDIHKANGDEVADMLMEIRELEPKLSDFETYLAIALRKDLRSSSALARLILVMEIGEVR